MSDISQIPLQELLDDKAASLVDIEVCKLALLHNVKEYSNGYSVQSRLDDNQNIVNVIDKELVERILLAKYKGG